MYEGNLIITIKNFNHKTLLLNNRRNENVDTTVHLGSALSKNNDEMVEIWRRILLANETYFSMTCLFKSRAIYKKNKSRIYKTIVKSILCFGAETWRLTKRAEDMLDKFERKILRTILVQY